MKRQGSNMNRRTFLKGTAGLLTLTALQPWGLAGEARRKTPIAMVKTSHRGEGTRQVMELLAREMHNKDVFIKPNFNTADPAPGSTHNETLKTIIETLRDWGAGSLTLGERSGPPQNTRTVMARKGVDTLLEDLAVEVVNFDELGEEDFSRQEAPQGHWQNGFLIPKVVLDAGCIVTTGCLKTHAFGGVFTLSLKNSVGLVPRRGYTYMSELHSSPHMEAMIAEINYAYTPDLIVMDGVEAFVQGGPARGERRNAHILWAGIDRVAVDAVGLAILKELGTTAEIQDKPIFQQEQIRRAVELDLGIDQGEDIEFLTADASSREYGQKLKAILQKG